MYNVAPYIKRCVDSIANQTYKNFEAIFVDDGSTDNTPQLCIELIANHPNMRMVCKGNGGLSSARLYGFHEALGKYIAFIDSDDYIEPAYIEILHNALCDNFADMSLCCYYLENKGNKSLQHLYYKDKLYIIDKPNIFSEYVLPQLPDIYGSKKFLPSFMWLRMFRRESINEDMFVSERDVYQEDLVFAVRSFEKYQRIAVVNVPLYNYCVNQGSLTLKYRENVLRMMTKLYNEVVNHTEEYRCEELNFRLRAFLLCAVHFVLRNASYLNYKSFKAVFDEIVMKQEIKDLIKSLDWFKVKRAYIVMGLLLLFRQPYLLYKFNRKRI